ncbi:hypothetical protein TNCT_341681 [Trichonephila clavata]|uniref:Uncharacterized protein n=1 Tax=Trichonephila clavata TaxID=2740835 RepID=A0A8X6K9E4_TRICU|nr:hypothetical protein TNCT_341681 [Trichonephila clavata]
MGSRRMLEHFLSETCPHEHELVKKEERPLQYPGISSAIQPVPHSTDMSILDPPKKYGIVKNYVEEK